MKFQKNTKIILGFLFLFLISFLVGNSLRQVEQEMNVNEIILKENQTMYSPEIRKELGFNDLKYEQEISNETLTYKLQSITEINPNQIIAFASQDLINISQAVGRANFFIIFENCEKIKEIENVYVNPDSEFQGHMAEVIPELLKNNSVDLLVGGNLGHRMEEIISNKGIKFFSSDLKIKDFIEQICI